MIWYTYEFILIFRFTSDEFSLISSHHKHKVQQSQIRYGNGYHIIEGMLMFIIVTRNMICV